MKKTISVFGMLGLLVMSCKNNDKKQDHTLEVKNMTEKITTPDMHTSQISLDWEGTYTGTLPCASCVGIKTIISLKADNTYTSEAAYLGEEEGKFFDKGNFEWRADGNTITLYEADGGKQLYKVVENAIILLNSDGKITTGELAGHYILSKK
ncbi:copper resistance protein NlpE [Arenibacter certesii]|uniref:Copper resistance protein n=1 Tax=Arenibacter certesii TaxID=228955 RepID=A0A918MJ93_9FLAO|nr:copper resistance protein NlpE [Arenibacter certesii]GGW26316.1 copper resistance protein [Arenibacter certesii]